jgi:hypothetical protein
MPQFLQLDHLIRIARIIAINVYSNIFLPREGPIGSGDYCHLFHLSHHHPDPTEVRFQ